MSELDNQISKIIEKSGHDFHLKVSKKLRDLGWSTIDNHYYNDPDSGKAREIDIIATKEYPIYKDSSGHVNEKIIIKLFIECKYINLPTIFWFKDRDLNSAIKLSKDNEILDDKPDNYVNDLTKHHYVKNDNVTGQWQSANNDIFSEAQHQVLKAMLFFKEAGQESYEINYPIIAINDFNQLFKRELPPKNHDNITENFQIEINYAYKNKQNDNITKYFLIDVVGLPMLEHLMDELEEKDVRLLRESLAYDLRQQKYELEARYSDDHNFDPYE